MKTRIISGIVMIVAVAAVLALGLTVNTAFIAVFVAGITGIAVYELLGNAAGIESKTAKAGAVFYVVLLSLVLDENMGILIGKRVGSVYDNLSYIITVVYFLFAVSLILKNHAVFSLDKIAVFCAMPLFVCYAFSRLSFIISGDSGIYYLLLLLNFSSVCDTGAYFVGSAIGKRKLCPEISPKKTVEGAIGGVVSSLIVSVILIFAFSKTDKLLLTVLLTVPFCVIGMLGDLFASAIKRSVGIKDYGNLIPGHGGILDRVDSILLIAPVLYIFKIFGVI